MLRGNAEPEKNNGKSDFNPRRLMGEARQQPTNKPLRDPTDNFTDNQWYCHLARQTVFFSAFSSRKLGIEDAKDIVREIVSLTPHLLSDYDWTAPIDGSDKQANGTEGAGTKAISEEILDRLVSIEKVKNLDNYPGNWPLAGNDIFDNPLLPPLRIKIAALNSGPDEQGRFAALLILSSHSVFEGIDAAKLGRSQPVDHAAPTKKPKAVSSLKKLAYKAIAAPLAPLQILAAAIIAPRFADVGFKALTLSRKRLRAGASQLGIRQQSLFFALAVFALNDGGKGFSKKSITSIYADLSKTEDFQTNDDFFQFRMIDLKLPVKDDFVDFALAVDAALKAAESGDKTKTQTLLNAMFGMHRWLHSRLPFLYTAKLFRFSAGYDLTLSLAPPLRLAGNLTRGLIEPVFMGTFHPGFNMCVFTPGREYITFNFSLRAKHLPKVDDISALLEQLEKPSVLQNVPASPPL